MSNENPWQPAPPPQSQPPQSPQSQSAHSQPARSPAEPAAPASNPYGPSYQTHSQPTPPPPPPPYAPQGASPFGVTYPPMPEGESRYGYGVPPTPAGGTRPGVGAKDANPFSALFDFSFAKFATPGLIKIVYILSVVIAGGTWLLFVLAGFSADSVVDGTGAGIIALLFGWIPALFSIAVTRFLLEGIVAVIRIHDRVTEIAARDAGETQA